MTNKIPKGLILSGCAASSAIDSSGEILDIEGADISDLEEGRGVLNYEHVNDKDKGASFNSIIGRIIFAKKLFKLGDCSTDDERKFWNQVKLPMIYIQVELFDEEGHPGAVAAAAMLRHYAARGLPMLQRYSIEGSTLEQDGQKIKKSIIRRVALTTKPCNRSCHSGILEDPKAPKGPEAEKDPLETGKAEEHPSYRKLGGSVELECDPICKMEELELDSDTLRANAYLKLQTIKKAITAGNYNAAPGSLTQGAALQVEDRNLHKARFKNQVMAVCRDYRKEDHGDLKAFLKHRLPEADPEFIDTFARLVSEYSVKKTEASDNELTKALTSPPNDVKGKTAKPEAIKAPAVIGLKSPRQLLAHLPADEPWFHDDSGTLNVPASGGKEPSPRKLHKIYIPGEEFKNLMDDPSVTVPHEHAVANWQNVNDLMTQKQTPPRVAMLASLLGFFSANEGVPVQELAVAHAMDMINGGYDPSKGPMTPEQELELRLRWSSRIPPEYEHDSMSTRPDLRIKTKKDPNFGQMKLVGLPDNKTRALNSYHRMHDRIMDLISQHGNNGRAIVGELVKDKVAYENWKKHAKGQETEYKGIAFDGIKNKILRYTTAMMGAGNIHIPDTHFLRHTFGLAHGKDNQMIKDVVWNENNAHLLNQIDKYYYAHHPAVRKTIDKFFGGVANEQAIFPAFWWHWLTIAADEKRRGLKTGSQHNDGTDHAVFFNGIHKTVQDTLHRYGIPSHTPALDKAEGVYPIPGIHHVPIENRVAYATEDLRQKYGEAAASWAMYAYMYPAIEAADRVDSLKQTAVQKTEELTIQLSYVAKLLKGDPLADQLYADLKDDFPSPSPPKKIVFRGAVVRPGEMHGIGSSVKGQKFHILGNRDGHHIVVPWDKILDFTHADLKSVRPEDVGTKFKLINPFELEPNSSSSTIISGFHGIPRYMRHPEQAALINGTDVSAPEVAKSNSGVNQYCSHWRKMGNGKLGYIKETDGKGKNQLSEAHSEALAYNVAKSMGLGHFYPTTSVFIHPVTGRPTSVMEAVSGGRHREGSSSQLPGAPVQEQRDMLHFHAKSGDLQKLALLDQIMANNDRHSGNYMFAHGQTPSIMMIDHGFTFAEDKESVSSPGYLRDEDPHWMNRSIHPEALKWLLAQDADKYENLLLDHGMQGEAKPFANRLRNLQQATTGYGPWGPEMSFGALREGVDPSPPPLSWRWSTNREVNDHLPGWTEQEENLQRRIDS